MTSSPNQTIICQEVFDENSHPSEEEIVDYAVKIGIDPKLEPHLLPIARDGLMHALPSEWKPCFDSSLRRWYYFNTKSGDSRWEHPLDPVYKDIVKRGRSEGYSSAGDDDSKTTAKEDLKSFEEVSDILSSKSNDNMRGTSGKNQERKSSMHTTSQPLLARRKQLQRGGSESLKPTPLQTAKVVNSTLRECNAKELNNSNEWPGSSLSATLNMVQDFKSRSVSSTPETVKQPMQPLRRARTLDPISDTIKPGLKREDTVPIKGILRDTSFNSLPQRSLARLDPMPGEYCGGISETDDERKRSVRFADFEYKAMDIKFQLSDSEESIYGVGDGDEVSVSSESPLDEQSVEPKGISGGALKMENIISEDQSKMNAHTPIRTIIFKRNITTAASGKLRKNKLIDDNESKVNEKQIFKNPFNGDSLINQPFFPKSISDVETSSSNSEHENNASAGIVDKEVSDHTGKFRMIAENQKTLDNYCLTGEEGTKSHLKQTKSTEEPATVDQNTEGSLERNDEISNKPKPIGSQNNSAVSVQKAEGCVSSARKIGQINRSNSILDYDIPLNEMEELAKKKASEKLLVFQEKLTKDIQEKITALKQQQNLSILEAKETIKKEELSEILKMRQDMEKRLSDVKNSFEHELIDQDKILRKKHDNSLSDLIKQLEADKEKHITEIKAKYEEELNSQNKIEEKRFTQEKSRLQKEADERILKSAKIIADHLNEIKAKEEDEISVVKVKSDRIVDELKKKFENNIYDLENKYKEEIKKIEDDHNTALKSLILDKEAELRRVETEWEDKLTASSLQHKATLESAISDHERNISTLRQQFQKDEEELKKRHAEQIEAWNVRVKRATDKESIDIAQMNRDFEKMRCEKRLLEDKYRSLKDKYVQLKSDMRLAVERKLQSRARRKREESALHERFDVKTTETDAKSPPDSILRNGKPHYNNNYVGSDNHAEKSYTGESSRSNLPRNLAVHLLRELPQDNTTDNDPSSTDDQYNSLSSTHGVENERKSGTSIFKEGRGKIEKQTRLKVERGGHQKNVSGHLLDNVKTQLQELEEIEERIPSNAHKDTYVRYPFLGPGLGTSAEVDFYRHRVLVEQEAVRAARECLLQQKRELEMRQNMLKSSTNFSTLYQQQQQERDLTEMEVSIHRTRALLGEKMIRLRLLGRTLDRLVQEPESPSNIATATSAPVPGDEGEIFTSEAGTFNVLQNLENINCEIREIWTQLSKTQAPAISPLLGPVEKSSAQNNQDTLLSPTPARRPTRDREAIESRLEELRQWLDKPKQPLNPTWTQLTL